MSEIWKDVADPFWAKYYEVSSSGQLRSKDRRVKDGNGRFRINKGRILKLNLKHKGAGGKLIGMTFSILEGGKRLNKNAGIAREVALVFVEKPEPQRVIMKRNGKSVIKLYEYMYVENIDGDHTNNFDWNLRWITGRDRTFRDCGELLKHSYKKKDQ